MKKILGIELGSTRIKAVLMDEKANVLAQGAYENRGKHSHFGRRERPSWCGGGFLTSDFDFERDYRRAHLVPFGYDYGIFREHLFGEAAL